MDNSSFLDLKASLSPIKISSCPSLERAREEVLQTLATFTLDNAPQEYYLLKGEVKFLEKVHSQSFIILSHRLKLIRDNSLYKEDGYSDFKSFIENELDIKRRTVYNYIALFEIFGVQLVAHSLKTANLFLALPYIKEHPSMKQKVFIASQEMKKKDFIVFLDSLKEESITPGLSKEEIFSWHEKEEDLIENSKFLRKGMKPKTVKVMIKELINLSCLQDPKNRTLEKMKNLLKNL